MVKRKIVIKVSMTGEKSRTKAMVLLSGASGVISVGVTGDDRLEVVGVDVDAVCLVACLRKEKLLRPVEILLVEEVKDKKKEDKKEEKKEDKKDDKKAEDKKPCCPGYPYYCYCYSHPIRPSQLVVCEDLSTSCAIM